MDLLKYIEEVAIPQDCECSYDGVAFDGCNYFFLVPCVCKIIKTDKCYKYVDCYDSCKDYNCICYDNTDNCFWAASKNHTGKIFKLNCKMEEIDYIAVRGCCDASGVITGLSYNCCSNTLFVAFAGSIVEIDKIDESSRLRYKSGSLWIIGICCVCPYYIITAIKGYKQYIILFDCENNPICTQLVPQKYTIKNIVFNPCASSSKHRRCHMFNLLATKRGCYPYMIHAEATLDEIGFHLCHCNYHICKKCCHDGSHCSSEEAITDVIESIALVETALSHVINAEGEKLQKVLATTNDTEKIMCVNKEINKTIINATHLEHALYAKLSAVLDCCDCSKKCKEICDDDCCEKSCKN